MDLGDVFFRSDADRHPWVIISDPDLDPSNIVVVNLTTHDPSRQDDPKKEAACVLDKGDHALISHPTSVNYIDAICTTLPRLEDAKRIGAIQFTSPMSRETLRKIHEGAANSRYFKLDYADILINQGLVDC